MRKLIVLATALPLLAACGSDQFSRVSTGAGTGAGTGATIGLIGGPIGVGLGAIIGAGVGAVAGGTTTPDQIDLGKPIWRKGDANAQANAQGYGGTAPISNDPQYRPPTPPQPGTPYVPDQGGSAVTSQPLAAPRS